MKLWSDKLDQGLLRSRLRAGAMCLSMADKHNSTGKASEY